MGGSRKEKMSRDGKAAKLYLSEEIVSEISS